MKALIASLTALGLIASPALAQSSSGTKSTKTMVTKGAKSTATTTVTTKVTPNKGKKHARHHARKHHAKKHAIAKKTTKSTAEKKTS